MARNYNLFISHSWNYTDAYEKFLNLINSSPRFSFRNYSVPKDDPIHNAPTSQALYKAIKQQMSGCHVVVILAGVYATYSEWINKEVKIATSEFLASKPILAVEPFASERTSRFVKENADRIVKWNTDSVITAIRELVP